MTTPRDPVPGALAENPDSVLLFPTNGLNYNSLSGARLGVGCWCDDHAFVGVEASGFFLGSRSTRTSFSSGPNGAPRLDVPVFDAATNQEDSVEISTPGETTGKINIASSSRLWGAEGNGLLNLYRDQGFSFDLLGGFRYLGLREDLTIDTYLAALPFAAVAFGGNIYGAPAATTTFDRFTTDNNFFGGQLGAKGRWQFGGLFLDVAGKVALGDTHQVLRIAGNSGLLIGGVNAATLPGGIFAQTTNIGRYSGDAFSVVPEVSARLGYKVTENVVVFAGYNFIYWSSVLRPGNQIDRAVNDTIAPTSNAYGAAQGDLSRPQPLFNTSGFWAHGVSWGLELRF